MLLYSNRSVLRQLLEAKGTVIYRPYIILGGVLCAALCLLLQYAIEQDYPWAPAVPNNYALTAMGGVVAFATVFRTSLAWNRYWEACSQLDLMYSKFKDVFSQYSVFARTTIENARAKNTEEARERAKRVHTIYENVHKHFSLLSALAMDRLAKGDNERMNRRMSNARWRDQITTRVDINKNNSIDIRQLPKFKASKLLQGNSEGTALAEDYGEGHSSTSHCYAIEHLPSRAESEALIGAEDRTDMVMTWIVAGFAKSALDLDTPPPIQSRMYQEMSNAMLAFVNCIKIADVPFPFAYSQLLCLLTLVFSVSVPFWVACFTQSLIAGPFFAFMLFECFWCINEVAKDLENPFGSDLNDIPLDDFHVCFLRSMKETHLALDVTHQGMVDGIDSPAGQNSEYLHLDTGLLESDIQVKEDSTLAGGPDSAVMGRSAPSSPAELPDRGSAAESLGVSLTSTVPNTQPRGCVPSLDNDRKISLGAVRVTRPRSVTSASANGGPMSVNFVGDRFLELMDAHMALLGTKVEEHLVNIAREIDALGRSSKVALAVEAALDSAPYRNPRG